MTTPYRKPVTEFVPGYTYEFEWSAEAIYRGTFVRTNKKIASTLLFKDKEKFGMVLAYPAVDADLSGHSWITSFSNAYLINLWEIAEPEAKKKEYDKKDWVAALFANSLPQHGLEVCPRCGSNGKKVRTAWMCDKHGVFAGF